MIRQRGPRDGDDGEGGLVQLGLGLWAGVESLTMGWQVSGWRAEPGRVVLVAAAAPRGLWRIRRRDLETASGQEKPDQGLNPPPPLTRLYIRGPPGLVPGRLERGHLAAKPLWAAARKVLSDLSSKLNTENILCTRLNILGPGSSARATLLQCLCQAFERPKTDYMQGPTRDSSA